MKHETAAPAAPPTTVYVCDSEKIQSQPATSKIGVECGDENSTALPEAAPKPPPSFYETIYYWLMARP